MDKDGATMNLKERAKQLKTDIPANHLRKRL